MILLYVHHMSQRPLNVSSWHPFAIAYAAALQSAGEATARVEREVTRVLAARGIDATVMATPTALWVDVGGSARVVRTYPGPPRLDLHQTLREIGTLVSEGRLSPEEATARIEQLPNKPGPYPKGIEQIAFSIAGASAAVLLGGGLADLVAAIVLSAIASALLALLSGLSGLSPLREPLVALIVALLAAPLSLAGASPSLVALASVIVLAPGLQLTLGMAEAASGHWTSGSARLTAAAVSASLLAAALSLPSALLESPPALLPAVALHPHAAAAAIVAGSLAVAILCRTPPRELLFAVGVALLSSAVARALPGPGGAALGAALAAGIAGVASRFFPLSPSLSLPALLLLVPGSIGVRSAAMLLGDDLIPGLQTAILAAITACALAVGLLVGHALATAPSPHHPSADPRRA